MTRTTTAAAVLALGWTLVMGSLGHAAVVWSSSFESYTENQTIVVNDTSGAVDTLSGYIDQSNINAPLIARTPVAGVELFTGRAANVTRGVSSSNGAIQFDRGNLAPLDDGGVFVISFDLQQRQWSSNQLLRAYSGNSAANSFAMAGNGGTGAMRSIWVINRTGAPLDMPHNLRETPPGPDNVNDDTYGGFSRRLNGSLFNHPSSATDVSLANFTSATTINRFLYNDNGGGQTAARDNWYDNFIVTDSVDDAFIGPDGQWRSILDLTVGTRPTSSFLSTGSTPLFTGSVVNSVDFTPSIASSGTAILNGPILNVTDTDAGWISFNIPSMTPSDETVILLDLGSSNGQPSQDYVTNELFADAALRGYTIATDHYLLDKALHSDFDVALSFFDLAPGDYNFSLRLGGDGQVYVSQFTVVSAIPIPEPQMIWMLAPGMLGLLRFKRKPGNK